MDDERDPKAGFDKEDGADDALFYAPPRLVAHIDAAAVAALSGFYLQSVPPDGIILDLMSSWVSHLPTALPTREVIGHGMNAVELAANPRLDRWFVQNLNHRPTLPLPHASVDACLCCVGVQYLQRPVDVFTDVRRILRPGAPCIVSFSNRCFPTKAVRIWRALGPPSQASLVRAYFDRAGFASSTAEILRDGCDGDPLVVVTGVA